MDLKMEVYTPGLELAGMLEVYDSPIWEGKAFTAGSFSLRSLITEETRSLLVPDNIIWIEGDTAGIIEHFDQKAGADGLYTAVKGWTLTGILNRRIPWGRYDLYGTPPEIMRYLVQECAVSPTRGDIEARKIPGLVLLDAPSGGEKIRIQKTGGNLLEVLEELGTTYQVPFGVRFNPQYPRMEFWTRWGRNLSVNQTVSRPVFYSTELDDVLSSEYAYDSSDYRNIALVAGEGEGNNRTMVTVEESGTSAPDVPTPSGSAPFIPAGSDVVMLTSDGQEFHAKAVATADGVSYVSAYTGEQIDTAIKNALSGSGAGTQGPPGQDATINGVNTLEIRGGDNITITQQSGVLTISATSGDGGGITMEQVNAAIQEAIFDSWEAAY